MAARLLGERGFLRRLGSEPLQFLDRVAQPVGLALRALDLGALRRQLALRARAARPTARSTSAASPSRPPKASSSARWVAASTSARSSCWPWISTSAAPSALQRLHAHRLVVDEGARAAVGELHAAQDQFVLGRDVVAAMQRARPDGPRGSSKAAVTCPCSAPWRTSAASPRAPSASAKASSRIDLPAPVSPVSTASPARNRCRAGRSGRCRGSKAGPACSCPRSLSAVACLIGTRHDTRPDARRRPSAIASPAVCRSANRMTGTGGRTMQQVGCALCAVRA